MATKTWTDTVGELWGKAWEPMGEIGGVQLPSFGSAVMGGITGAPYAIADAIYRNLVKQEVIPGIETLFSNYDAGEATAAPKMQYAEMPAFKGAGGAVDPNITAAADAMTRLQAQGQAGGMPFADLLLAQGQQSSEAESGAQKQYEKMLLALGEQKLSADLAAQQQGMRSLQSQMIREQEAAQLKQAKWSDILAGGIKAGSGIASSVANYMAERPQTPTQRQYGTVGDYNLPASNERYA